MRKVRDILRYFNESDLSQDQIARALRISKGSVSNTVKRFTESCLTWQDLSPLSDSDLEARLYPESNQSQALVPLPDVSYLEKELRRPHVTLQSTGSRPPSGLGRRQFYEYFRKHRPHDVDMRMFHKGGDKLFVDYSGDGLRYIDKSSGKEVSVELFVCSWGASSYTYVEATASQQVKDFVASHVRAFTFFGVVPQALVPDNLRSGVKKSSKYDPTMNPLYQKMAQHYGTVVLPARVAAPKDKAVVESNVGHAQRYILARLRNRIFYSLQEINEAILEELQRYNAHAMKEYGNQCRKARFEELDYSFAKQQVEQRFLIRRMKERVRVAPDYHIRYEDHYYSVPHAYARSYVDVYEIGAIIEIYHDGKHLCRHLYSTRKYEHTTVKEHMPPQQQFVKGWSARWFIFEAGKVGPATAEAVKQIMRSREHVEQGYKAALGILRFEKVYDAARLENACLRALHFKCPSYRSIKSILEQELDKQPWDTASVPSCHITEHENVRGPQYYENYSDNHEERITECI